MKTFQQRMAGLLPSRWARRTRESQKSYRFLDLSSDRARLLSNLESYFLQYDAGQWNKGSGGGFFERESDGVVYSLIIAHDPRFGILLQYAKGKVGGSAWYSVGRIQLMSSFEESPSEMLLPVGAYIEPAHAWKALQDFDANPESLPPSVQWIESSKIPWPEM